MDGTWDVRRKSQWWPGDFWSTNRSMELPFAEIWKTRGEQAWEVGGRVEFNFRPVKLELLYDIKMRYWVGSWTYEFVVQSRIWDWNFKCGVSSIGRNQGSRDWSLSRREWSPVPNVADGANKMTVGQCIWPHGGTGDLDKQFPSWVWGLRLLAKVGLGEWGERKQAQPLFQEVLL